MRGSKMARDDSLFNRGVSRHYWRMCARRRASPVERALASHRQGERSVQCDVLLCGRQWHGPRRSSIRRGRSKNTQLLLKWNISFVGVFLILMPWFTSAFTGRQPFWWLVVITVGIVALLAINLIQPFGLQLAVIERIETKHMPWGEAFASPAGRLATSFWFSVAAVLIASGDSVIRFLASWRRQHSGTSMMMMLSATVYFVAVFEGVLVRAQFIDFMHLGPFGFFAMVIAMSLTLSFRSRQNLVGFRAALPGVGGTVAIWNTGTGGRWWNGPGESRVGTPLGQRTLRGIRASRGRTSCCRPSSAPYLGQQRRDEPHAQARGEQWVRSFAYPIKDPNGDWCAMSS